MFIKLPDDVSVTRQTLFFETLSVALLVRIKFYGIGSSAEFSVIRESSLMSRCSFFIKKLLRRKVWKMTSFYYIDVLFTIQNKNFLLKNIFYCPCEATLTSLPSPAWRRTTSTQSDSHLDFSPAWEGHKRLHSFTRCRDTTSVATRHEIPSNKKTALYITQKEYTFPNKFNFFYAVKN